MNALTMDQMWSVIFDFLIFQTLLSPAILMVVYYLGAVALPYVAWRTVKRWRESKPHLFGVIDVAGEQLERLPSGWRLATVTVLLFVTMEILWRMMFEAMIGYFQMHSALQTLSAAG